MCAVSSSELQQVWVQHGVQVQVQEQHSEVFCEITLYCVQHSAIHCTVQIHCTMQCTLYIFTVQIQCANSLYKFPVQSTVHCTRVEEAISPLSSGGGRATFGETIWRRQLNI